MIEDVIVVGDGLAGAACALWARQLGMRVLLVEAEWSVGPSAAKPLSQSMAARPAGQVGQEVAPAVTPQGRSLAPPGELQSGEDPAQPARAGWDVSNEEVTHAGHYVVIATGSVPRRGEFVETSCVVSARASRWSACRLQVSAWPSSAAATGLRPVSLRDAAWRALRADLLPPRPARAADPQRPDRPSVPPCGAPARRISPP
jgi:glycine/D-amino acid oxidase-like deaminating enzyme